MGKRQTVFFTSVDPMNKEHIDPSNIDFEAPRIAWYEQKKWKKDQDTVCWVDIQLAQRKGLKFCQKDRKQSSFTTHSQLIEELGSEFARQAEDNQSTQPNPNPICRTGKPVVTEQTSRSSPQEIDTRFSLDCENTNLSFERVDKDKDADENVDADQTSTGRPVAGSSKDTPFWLKAISVRTELYSFVRLVFPRFVCCGFALCRLLAFSFRHPFVGCLIRGELRERGRSRVEITSSDPISESTPAVPRTVPDVDTEHFAAF